jgi:hypothetical protein
LRIAEEALSDSEAAQKETEKRKRQSEEKLSSIKKNVALMKKEKSDLTSWKKVIEETLPVINRIENSVKVSEINL